jgi:mono/diheme cytochrome c family protein
MKKRSWVLIVVVLSVLLLAACGGGGDSDNDSDKQRQSPPADYAGVTNPFEGQADAAAQGKELFATNCATCHGDNAAGDGAAGQALDPKPANLQQTAKETDPTYTHWVISEGGAAAGLSSSMVAYKGILTDEQIWQIVTFLEETYGK